MPRKRERNTGEKDCMIDVVLEKGAEAAFSGIRLLIVFRETEDLKEVSFQENLNDAGRWYMSANLSGRPSLRDLHSRRRTEINAGKTLLNNEDALCPVTFEVIRAASVQSSNSKLIELVPLQSVPSSESNLRLVYDRTHAVLPSKRTSFDLTCSHTFNRNYSYETYDSIYAHTLRIIPVQRSQPSFRYLDAVICRNIAWHAFFDKPTHWRRSLLNLALVSRTWAGVADLFFYGLPSGFNHDRAPAAAVARTVKSYPYKGRLIRLFEPERNWTNSFDATRDEGEFLRFSQEIVPILRAAPLVTRLELTELHSSINKPFIEVLRGLGEVEELKICRFHYSESPSYFKSIWKPDIGELQNTFAGWEKLKKVDLTVWDVSLNSGSEPPDAAYNLEELSLYRGALPGNILMRFLSATPALHSLDLFEVTRITNDTLRRFLATVAPTLVMLRIQCALEPYDTLAEEPALDAVMPNMHLLSKVRIACRHSGRGMIATPKSVGRKPMTQGRATLPGSLFEIKVSREDFDPEELLRTVEISGWEYVIVRWIPSVDGWDRIQVKLDSGQYIDIRNGS
ncbi:hypothetical protein DXG03_001028 [Asterophora parasitica]|uniref:Uncharacterized protein n=1 Tax=Asterophora parasitica TaxID=117018 RepID=A0A9P7K9R4_9AGAR|nr:hypothetical protein DXG03_001028 [Asterophora parasitica]